VILTGGCCRAQVGDPNTWRRPATWLWHRQSREWPAHKHLPSAAGSPSPTLPCTCTMLGWCGRSGRPSSCLRLADDAVLTMLAPIRNVAEW